MRTTRATINESVSEVNTLGQVSAGRSGLPIIAQLVAILPLLFVFAIFIGYFGTLLVYGRALFSFPFDYDQGEGFELYDAIRLARGEQIYLDNTIFPFYSSNYPPVYRLMLVPFIWLFGPHIWVGRVVAFGSALAIGLFIFLAARRQLQQLPMNVWGASPLLNLTVPVSLLAALAFFAANYVYQIAPLARAHLPMVMFAFAGIFFIERAFEHDKVQTSSGGGQERLRYTSLLLGLALLLLAGFTKLQAVDALVAGFAYFLIRKPWLCLVSVAACAAVTGIVVVLLDNATHGQFWLNVVLANVNEYDIESTWFFYGQWFRLEGVLIVCSVLYVVWDLVAALRARSLRPITLWSLYFSAGSAMGMLTGKWGAGPTYLIAAIAASCVCTAGLLWRVAHVRFEMKQWRFAQPRGQVTYVVAALLFAVVFFCQALLNIHLPTSGMLFGSAARLIGVAGQSSNPPYPYYDSIGYTQLGHLLDPADIQNGWELVRIVREAQGPVWSEEAMLTLHAGKDVVTNPTQLRNLSKSNKLDTTEMIEMIRARVFGAVIFRAQFYPEDVLIAIGRNYHWVQAVRMNGFDYQVLFPNQK